MEKVATYVLPLKNNGMNKLKAPNKFFLSLPNSGDLDMSLIKRTVTFLMDCGASRICDPIIDLSLEGLIVSNNGFSH